MSPAIQSLFFQNADANWTQETNWEDYKRELNEGDACWTERRRLPSGCQSGFILQTVRSQASEAAGSRRAEGESLHRWFQVEQRCRYFLSLSQNESSCNLQHTACQESHYNELNTCHHLLPPPHPSIRPHRLCWAPPAFTALLLPVRSHTSDFICSNSWTLHLESLHIKNRSSCFWVTEVTMLDRISELWRDFLVPICIF